MTLSVYARTWIILAAGAALCGAARAEFVDERSAPRPAVAASSPQRSAPAAGATEPNGKTVALPPRWRVDPADGTLSRALRRWAGIARYPLLWEAPKDLPAIGAVYVGEFLAAVEQVMKDSANSEYPLHACAYDNVVRVLHASQSCAR